MAGSEKIIYIYADWIGNEPILIGKLFTMYARGKEVFSFEYDNSFLNSESVISAFDPDLQLYRGRQYLPTDKANFGIFSDSSPERFGRMLMSRREAILAKKEDRKPRALTESDYLLGVYDEARMGALRFKTEKEGSFLSCDKALATPPWTTLRDLENASFALENEDDENHEKWLNILIAPGSSLGGARPKASVMAPDHTLWIAKFPSRHDDFNTGAWEMVAHDLAVLCGLDVPDAKLEYFSDNGGTFLVKRFDRDGKKRIHYSSAMTLLGKTDGDDSTGYPDIAEFIRQNGASPKKDLEELFCRIAFSISVSNTDDHLRNHGFLLCKNGWRLSPVFDVNPNNHGDYLHLSIAGCDNSKDYNLLVKTAKYYGLSEKGAQEKVDAIKETVTENWRKLAEKYRIGRAETERMTQAFSMAASLNIHLS